MAEGRVGRYEIIREVARGGFAVVYLATQLGLDRHVALKELSALQATDRSVVERFLRESRMAGSLNHPNIVTVYEYFEHEGAPFISMEYLERGALRPLLDQLTVPQICGVLEGVLAGLAYAEKKGIIHRDLKPENLMVTSEGGVKITDFGIAKAVGHVTSHVLTATGMTIGTPVYMAPEQAMASPIGPWTDLYSLGVIAYELFLGRVPFEEMEFPVAVLYRHIHDQIPPPLVIKPDLDPGLAAWIEKLLEKDPKQRYQRAVDAWDDLEEVILDVIGPRWRRDARLLETKGGLEPDVINKSLSPAPFHLGSSPPNELRVPLPPLDQADEQDFERGDYQIGTPALHVAEAVEENGAQAQVSEVATHPPGPEEGVDELRTLPPMRKQERAPEATETPDKRRRFLRPRLLLGIALACALVIGGLGTTSFMGASENRSQKSVAGVAPYVLIPAERISLAVAEAVYVAHPDGRVIRLDRTTLEPLATLRHPPRPQSLVLGPDELFVADKQALTELRKGDLAPEAATGLGDETVFLAGLEGGAPLVAAAVAGEDAGVMCEYVQTLLSPITPIGGRPPPGFDLLQEGKLGKSCLDLTFAPSGIGTHHTGTYIADDLDGSIVAITGTGKNLAVGQRINVGINPHGQLRPLGEHLYVPVKDGVAVVDLEKKKLARTLRLPATPSAIWVIPSIGRLAAALPDRDEVVIFNEAAPDQKPVTVKIEGRPVSLGGALGDGAEAGFLYVATAADGIMHRINPLTQELAGTKQLPGIGAGLVEPVVVRDIAVVEANGMLTFNLNFETGAIEPPGVVVTDPDISDGTASIQVRQGAVSTKIDQFSDRGVTIEIGRGPSHLVVKFSTEERLDGQVQARPGPDGRSLIVDLGKVQPVIRAPRVQTPVRSVPTTRSTRSVRTTKPAPAPIRTSARPPSSPSPAPAPSAQSPSPSPQPIPTPG